MATCEACQLVSSVSSITSKNAFSLGKPSYPQRQQSLHQFGRSFVTTTFLCIQFRRPVQRNENWKGPSSSRTGHSNSQAEHNPFVSPAMNEVAEGRSPKIEKR